LLNSCTPNSKKIPLTEIWKHVEYQNESNPVKVRNEYEELKKANPQSGELYYLLSRCIENEQERFDTLTKGLSKFPNNPYVLGALGSYYLDKERDVSKGKEYCEKALQNDSKNLLAAYKLYYYYGKLTAKENTYEAQITYYEAIIKYLAIAKESPYHSIYLPDEEIVGNSDIAKDNIDKFKMLLGNCVGHETELKNYEINRISGFSNVLIFDLNIYYIGSCKYKSVARVFDQAYGNYVDINITYKYADGTWINTNDYK
ncbi:tetratricopeptide repeat protein, partial [Flavobacterium sp.]|uniref:tetratricopeptide repeat protein n=1 Tax=Flavobacterium sp. TaxID=239 RepID=UPI00374D082B